MKYIATLVFAALLNSAAFAQFGINATYRSNDAPDWEYAKGSSVQNLLPETTAAIGLDYWIPLKAYRIDFLPELNFQQLSNTVEVSNIIRQFDAQLDNTWLSLFLNTNIYFLDLEGDCDCPTFSKSGGLLQKGLFLQLSPGATWMRNKVEVEGQKADSNDITFSGAAGLGLDIGLSDLISVWQKTPVFASFSLRGAARSEGGSPAAGRSQHKTGDFSQRFSFCASSGTHFRLFGHSSPTFLWKASDKRTYS